MADRDRRRPVGPPPGVPLLPERPEEETTGQHVRVQLVELSAKVDEAIAIDKNDHRLMTDTMSQHSRQIQQLKDHVSGELRGIGERVGKAEGVIARTENAVARVEGEVTGIGGKLDGLNTAVQTLNTTVQGQQNIVHLGIRAKTDIEVHETKTQIDERADVRKRRREIGYSVLKVMAIAAATWLLAHYTGLH